MKKTIPLFVCLLIISPLKGMENQDQVEKTPLLTGDTHITIKDSATLEKSVNNHVASIEKKMATRSTYTGLGNDAFFTCFFNVPLLSHYACGIHPVISIPIAVIMGCITSCYCIARGNQCTSKRDIRRDTEMLLTDNAKTPLEKAAIKNFFETTYPEDKKEV